MHHKRGQLDCIWADMTIEVTSVRFVHSKGGIIGSTTKSETLTSTCNKIQEGLSDIKDEFEINASNTHKDEIQLQI